MSDISKYNETVIIPLLQKKYQDLMNSNLFLEASLLVEQAKLRDAEDKFKNLENEFNIKYGNLEDEKNKLQKNIKQDVYLHEQVRELQKIADERSAIISENRSAIRELDATIQDLKKQLNKFTSQQQSTSVSKKKKIEPKEDILDGESF